MQVSPVTMSLPKSRSSTLFSAVHERSAEGGLGFLLFPFGFCFGEFLEALAFALGFLVWEVFGREKNY
jgi:hypothetical protein